MGTYEIHYTKKDIIAKESEPQKAGYFYLGAESIEEAASEASCKLLEYFLFAMSWDLWGAYVFEKETREEYEILKEGNWLIDLDTGKKKSLESMTKS